MALYKCVVFLLGIPFLYIGNLLDKFIEYEQGIRAGEDRRVTKGMKDKGGYWYKNETLIERLVIVEAEQKHLKTIIGTRVKYDRKNNKRNWSECKELVNYVPYDNYPLLAHHGEMILTASEARNYREGAGANVNVTGNTFVVREEADINKIVSALVDKLSNARMNYGGAY